jgi:hypothetical protein
MHPVKASSSVCTAPRLARACMLRHGRHDGPRKWAHEQSVEVTRRFAVVRSTLLVTVIVPHAGQTTPDMASMALSVSYADMAVQCRFVRILVQVFASKSDCDERAVFAALETHHSPIPRSTTPDSVVCHSKRQTREITQTGEGTIVSESHVTCIIPRPKKERREPKPILCGTLCHGEKSIDSCALETNLSCNHSSHIVPERCDLVH